MIVFLCPVDLSALTSHTSLLVPLHPDPCPFHPHIGQSSGDDCDGDDGTGDEEGTLLSGQTVDVMM